MEKVTFDFNTLAVDPEFHTNDFFLFNGEESNGLDRCKTHQRIKKKLKECLKYLSKHRHVNPDQFHDPCEIEEDDSNLDDVDDQDKDDKTIDDMTRGTVDDELVDDADEDMDTHDDETKITTDSDDEGKHHDRKSGDGDAPLCDDQKSTMDNEKDEIESLIEFESDVFVRHDYMEFSERNISDRFRKYRALLSDIEFGDCSDLGLGNV